MALAGNATAGAAARWWHRLRIALWGPVVLVVVIYLIDLATPRGMSIPIAYIALIHGPLWARKRWAVFVYAAIVTALIAIAFFFKPSYGVTASVSIVNRSLTVGMLWYAAALAYRRLTLEQALGESAILTASMRREARARSALLATIVESSEDAIWSKSPQGTITSWNGGAERLFGYAAEEAIGRPVSMLIPEALREEERGFMGALLHEGKPVRSFETVRLCKSGREVDVSITVSVIKDGEGTVIGTSTSARDITSKKRAEAELLQYTQALVRSNQDLDDFAYAASHDLKAPLRVIDNASKWLEEDLQEHLTPETREHMQLLRGRVRRMEKLLNDLLEYARIGRKTNDDYAERIAGDALMENVLALLAPPEGFSVHVGPAFAGIEVYRMPLQQVLMNLIGNAIKHHSRKQGRVEVTVEAVDGGYSFAVIDDGPGIPPQFQTQIFKMFQTLKPRDQMEGSGMGLAMVRKHVEVSGGTIAVESAEGLGSVFRFTWPVVQPGGKVKMGGNG